MSLTETNLNNLRTLLSKEQEGSLSDEDIREAAGAVLRFVLVREIRRAEQLISKKELNE